jgi:hypothetical protein
LSSARRARQARIAKHKADGTYVPRLPVSDDIVQLVAREGRIKRGRESLLESSEYSGARTKVRAPTAPTHQIAPPNEATPGRNSCPARALYAD